MLLQVLVAKSVSIAQTLSVKSSFMSFQVTFLSVISYFLIS